MDTNLINAELHHIDFEDLWKDDIKASSEEAIQKAEKALNTIYTISNKDRNTSNTLIALDDLIAEIMKVHAITTLMAYVHPEKKLREEALKQSAQLSKFFNKLGMDRQLFQAVKNYSTSSEATKLKGAQRKFLDETLRDFRRNGLELDDEKQKKIKKLQDELSEMAIEFEHNINAHEDYILITEEESKGLPEDYKKERKTREGEYKIDLSYPSYVPFMKYAENDELRKKLSIKFRNIAADKNLAILKKILIKRKELASILGYSSYAAYQTEVRMAKTPEHVWKFEEELKEKVRKKALKDEKELLEIKNANRSKSSDTIYSWQGAYYTQKLLKEKYEVDHEKIKAYFSLDKVLKGLFDIVEKLYGIQIAEIKEEKNVWHKDVRQFVIRESNQDIAGFYLDLFPRKGKFHHAACFDMIPGKAITDGYQQPVSSLVCNFPIPGKNQPSLLPHGDVETLFHEFGHLMHQLLTRADLATQSGTSVSRDFVEMPSQIFEHWAWHPEALRLFARHYLTDEILPDELINKLNDSKNVASGIHNLQQIFYGTLDFTLHDKYDPEGEISTTQLVEKLQEEITLYPFLKDTHFEAGFGHLMGYAAGYYSYLWAKVYAEDMFSVFKEKGVLNPDAGQELRKTILERGSEKDEMEIVKDFLGREPNENAFLISIGLQE